MKLTAAVCAFITGFASLVRGEPICASGTLASYVALGTQGCTIGSNLLSDFKTLSGINLATPIPPSDITVTPLTTGNDIALTFSFSSNASGGAILEALIGYSISGGPYTGVSISANGTSASGNGAVTDIQNFCREGSLFGPGGVSGCSTGQAGSLLLLGDGSITAPFGATTFLSVTDDITFDSGGSGSANRAAGGLFIDRFAAAPARVPEPRTLALLIAGAITAVFIRLTDRNRRRFL